jgi:hypothetical protein
VPRAPAGLPGVGCSLCAVCVFAVWMLSVTGVIALPAAIVAGEKVAVEPVGRPVTENVIGSRKHRILPPFWRAPPEASFQSHLPGPKDRRIMAGTKAVVQQPSSSNATVQHSPRLILSSSHRVARRSLSGQGAIS